MPHDVYIGYSRRDSVAAEAIQKYLTDAGISCFRDTTNIVGSEEWVKTIAKAIEKCHVFLAIVSQNSVTSQYVAKELAYATRFRRQYVPVLLTSDIEVPEVISFHLGDIQHIVAEPSLSAVLPQITAITARVVDRQKHKAEWADLDDVVKRSSYDHRIDCAVDSYGLTNFTFSNGTGRIEGSGYALSSEPNDYLGSHLERLPVTSEFILEARLRHCTGPSEEWFGIEFGQSYPGDYYQFLLNSNRAVHISKHFRKVWSNLFDRAGLGFVYSSGQQNHLVVVRRDKLIHLFVNDRHVVSIDDFEIRTGTPGLMVGRGIRVEFTDLRVAGVSLESKFADALNHWCELETKKAKQILEYVAKYDPVFKTKDWPQDAGGMLREIRPDRNETVLITIGSGISSQLQDGMAAERLREAINRKGRGLPFRWAAIVTDTALLQDQVYTRCPIISVGGRIANQFTARMEESQQEEPGSPSGVHIQHSTKPGERQVALWGNTGEETAAAVEMFVTSERLDSFLTSIWESL
jgi:hypothetical protein